MVGFFDNQFILVFINIQLTWNNSENTAASDSKRDDISEFFIYILNLVSTFIYGYNIVYLDKKAHCRKSCWNHYTHKSNRSLAFVDDNYDKSDEGDKPQYQSVTFSQSLLDT